MGALLIEAIALVASFWTFLSMRLEVSFWLCMLLYVGSGIWKSRPINFWASMRGLVVHLASPFLGILVYLFFIFLVYPSEMLAFFAAYLIASFIYFVGNDHWPWIWKLGSISAVTAIMIGVSQLSSVSTEEDQLAYYFLLPILLGRMIEMVFAVYLKLRGKSGMLKI